jgi:hypothetical protein
LVGQRQKGHEEVTAVPDASASTADVIGGN